MFCGFLKFQLCANLTTEKEAGQSTHPESLQDKSFAVFK